MSEGNNQPFLTLELDKHEAKFLRKVLAHREVEMDAGFKEWCSMSSSDPRSTYRALMTMELAGDVGQCQSLGERMDFNPEISKHGELEAGKARKQAKPFIMGEV